MNTAWKQDPRLKTMDPEKVKYLSNLAETVERTPKDKLMPLFMSMAAGSSQYHFSDDETDLLVSIMTAKMNPAEKKAGGNAAKSVQALRRRETGQAEKKGLEKISLPANPFASQVSRQNFL